MLTLAGCGSAGSGAELPSAVPTTPVTQLPAQAASSSPTPAAATGPSAAATHAQVSGGCRVAISGSIVRLSGGGRAMSGGDGQRFACRTGPIVTITGMDSGGVRFGIGSAQVPVAVGASGTVGPYRISVLSAGPGRAELDVVTG